MRLNRITTVLSVPSAAPMWQKSTSEVPGQSCRALPNSPRVKTGHKRTEGSTTAVSGQTSGQSQSRRRRFDHGALAPASDIAGDLRHEVHCALAVRVLEVD